MASRRDVIALTHEMSGVEINWSPDGALAVYFRFSDKPVAKTVEWNPSDIIVDLDKAGEVVGLELLNPQEVSLKKLLRQIAKKFHSDSIKTFETPRIEKIQELLAV